MRLQVLDSIASLPREAWDALLDEAATPFVRWDFLEALESTRCASPRSDWVPRHLAAWRDGQLVACAPAYVRRGSDGDFSRDWGWASAASRAGLAYYPKLSMTVPFTPCTGRRILVAPGENRERSVAAIVGLARDLCRRERLGSLQFLFPLAGEAEELEKAGLALRVDHQFHWQNEGYRTFEAPAGGFVEQVFEHELAAEGDGRVPVGIVNRRLGLGAYEVFRRDQLPRRARTEGSSRAPSTSPRRTAFSDATGAPSRSTPSCTSTSASTTRSATASSGASARSKAAPAASTSCRAASCRRKCGVPMLSAT